MLRARDRLRARRLRVELQVPLPLGHIALQLLVWDMGARGHDLGEEVQDIVLAQGAACICQLAPGVADAIHTALADGHPSRPSCACLKEGVQPLLVLRDAWSQVEVPLPSSLVARRDRIASQQFDLLEELREAAIAAGQRIAAKLCAPLEPRAGITFVVRRWKHVLGMQVPQRRVLRVCGLAALQDLHGITGLE